MRTTTLIMGLLIGPLLGCNSTNQEAKITPTPEVSKSPKSSPLPQATQPTESQVRQKQSIAQAAKLTPEQVEQLESLKQNNPQAATFKFVVPTYIPDGFQVELLEAEVLEADAIDQNGAFVYNLVYRNPQNVCFSIHSSSSNNWQDSFTSDYKTVEVNSKTLGKVVLNYTDFDGFTQGPYIGFKKPIWQRNQKYTFESGSGIFCNSDSISIEEAVKVVESFKYLNP